MLLRAVFLAVLTIGESDRPEKNSHCLGAYGGTSMLQHFRVATIVVGNALNSYAIYPHNDS